MKSTKVRNTYRNRAEDFFKGDKELVEKYVKYFKYDNEDLLNISESPRTTEEERKVFLGIIDYNRAHVKSKSDTTGKSNLPFSHKAIDIAQKIMLKKAGESITIADEPDSEKELVSVQVLIKYKDNGAIKTKSLDKHGNGLVV